MKDEELRKLQNSMMKLSRKWTSTSIVITELKEELDELFVVLNDIVVAETTQKASEKKQPEKRKD